VVWGSRQSTAHPGTVESVAVEPDSKDWTWVLDRPCPDCGFDASSFAPLAVDPVVRSTSAAWKNVLGRPDVTDRVRPDRWSALEYGCHIRDVYTVMDFRLALMLADDDPTFPNWDQDETAADQRYGEQYPAAVAAELMTVADPLAARFEGVRSDQWERTGTRSNGSRFTVATLGKYLIHDVVHHLADVHEPWRWPAA
jgi:hypothetical protein